MSRLSRKEFKELLTEWNYNFINENSYEKQNLIEFFNFVKSNLPVIITALTPSSFEGNNLELHTLDGNHRLEVFKRVLLELKEDKGIPAIILYEGKEYEDLLEKSGYSFNEHDEADGIIKKRINNEGKKIINRYIQNGYQIKFCNSLNIKDFGKGANNPTPIVNDYMQSLYSEFIKNNKSKSFDTSNLILTNPKSNSGFDDDDDEFTLIP